jgi:hypothetical protein
MAVTEDIGPPRDPTTNRTRQDSRRAFAQRAFVPGRDRRNALRLLRPTGLGSSQPPDFRWPADRHVEVGHQAVGQRIDPAVHREVVSARPGRLHDDV